MLGKVLKSTGSWYQVMDEAGHRFDCRLRGKFKIKGMKVTNPLAVGDNVVFELENKSQGIITEIEPRENYIIRRSPQKTEHGHLIAANIDQAIMIATLILPRTSTGFIDRFLVTAESFRIPAKILFNKMDLLDQTLRDYQRQLVYIYEKIGYQCLQISALEKNDVLKFQKWLQGKSSLISGHSGVGKSTLINQIAPQVQQKIAEVSSFANKGVHTTTFAEMFEIGQNSFIIDTPGIKEFGLLEIEDEELSHFFPEMRELFGKCKYYNCTHTHEPGCAIEKAFEQGDIAASRYQSYLSILEGEDNRR